MKNRLTLIFGALVFSSTLLAAADGAASSLRVRALIDGRDQLVIRPDSIHWQHFDYWRPGRADRKNEPTYFGTYDWRPTWPDANDESAGPSLNVNVSVTFASSPVTMQVISGRSIVRILQQPDSTNGQTLVLEFDDDAVRGDAWYEIVLLGVTANFQPPLSIAVGSIVVNWNSETNRTYQVQYTTNLQSGAWVDLGAAVQGTGSNIVVTDSQVAGPRRFYRLTPVP